MGFQPFPIFGQGLRRGFGRGGGNGGYFASIMSFSPLLFLDADLGLLFTDAGGTIPAVNNNDNVSLWKDRSNSFFDMAAGTAANLQTSVAAYKSKKTVLFTAASSQYLVRTMGGIVANLTTYNIIVVTNKNAGAVAACIYSEGADASGTPFVALRTRVTNDGEVHFQHRGDGATVATVQSAGSLINNASPHLISCRRISAASFDVRCDGVSVGTSSSNPGTTTVQKVTVGTRYSNGALASYWDGQLSALIITPGDSYASLEPLLAARYGVVLP